MEILKLGIHTHTSFSQISGPIGSNMQNTERARITEHPVPKIVIPVVWFVLDEYFGPAGRGLEHIVHRPEEQHDCCCIFRCGTSM